MAPRVRPFSRRRLRKRGNRASDSDNRPAGKPVAKVIPGTDLAARRGNIGSVGRDAGNMGDRRLLNFGSRVLRGMSFWRYRVEVNEGVARGL